MTEVIRRYAKYIFLDVVQFSKRNAEPQSDIIKSLNAIVRQSLNSKHVRAEDCILLPTGDGMCIALPFNPTLPYDIHIQIALNILELLDLYNKSTTDVARQFQIKIGLNQNTDILFTDTVVSQILRRA